MAEHDGWTLKNTGGRNSWLIPCYFAEKRREIIDHFEKIFLPGSWRRHRDRGAFKIVKIKLMEVS